MAIKGGNYERYINNFRRKRHFHFFNPNINVAWWNLAYKGGKKMLTPGEYKCCICNLHYPEDDIHFSGDDPICYDCYEDIVVNDGRCSCGAILKNSEKSQCYMCKQASYRDRENNTRGWIGDRR